MWGDYSTQRFWQFEQESWPRVLRDRGNLEKLVSYSKSMQQNNYGGIYLARWPYLVQCTWTNPGKCSPSSSASQLCKSLNKGQGGETFFSSLSQHPLWKQFFFKHFPSARLSSIKNSTYETVCGRNSSSEILWAASNKREKAQQHLEAGLVCHRKV